MSKITTSIKAILKSKIAWGHFIFFFVISVILAPFLYILAIPLVFWGLFGSGAASARIEELPINTFIGEWAALIIVLMISLTGIFINLKQQDLGRAKSHLLTAAIIIGLYMLRKPILHVAFDLFQ